MDTKQKYLIKAISVYLFIALATTVNAAPRGTPTVVTNDTSLPVAITGTVSATNANLYKAVGVTSATFNANQVYKKSAACASEFPGSRICSSEELVLAPGRVSVGATGAWIIPTIIAVYNGSGAGGFDITGIHAIDGFGNYKSFCLINNDISNLCNNPAPVLCCAP